MKELTLNQICFNWDQFLMFQNVFETCLLFWLIAGRKGGRGRGGRGGGEGGGNSVIQSTEILKLVI